MPFHPMHSLPQLTIPSSASRPYDHPSSPQGATHRNSLSPTETVDEEFIASPASPPNPYLHESSNSCEGPNRSYYSYGIVGYRNRDFDDGPLSHLSDSPSPVDMNSNSSSYANSMSGSYPSSHIYPGSLPQHSETLNDRYLFGRRTPSSVDGHSYHYHDQRRMSEPSVFGQPFVTPQSDLAAGRYQQFSIPQSSSSISRISPLQRGVSTGSMNDLQHPNPNFEFPSSQHGGGGWKTEELAHQLDSLQTSPRHASLDQPGSSQGTSSSPEVGKSLVHGRSPPSHSRRQSSYSSHNASSREDGSPPAEGKSYSFVALPGNAVKKRPRRRYDEIERLYQCSWLNCNKAYGTLNHLNAHVTMQKHGSKRSPNEFKELRKQWRKAKKDTNDAYSPSHHSYDDHHHLHRNSMHFQEHDFHGNSHSFHHGLPTRINVPINGADGRYGMDVPVDEIRYPLDDSDLLEHERRGGMLSSSPRGYANAWHSMNTHGHVHRNSISQHEGGLDMFPQNSSPPVYQQQPQSGMLSQSMPSMSNSVISRLAASPGMQRHNITPNRLPADSTLLTPLPGYISESRSDAHSGHVSPPPHQEYLVGGQVNPYGL